MTSKREFLYRLKLAKWMHEALVKYVYSLSCFVRYANGAELSLANHPAFYDLIKRMDDRTALSVRHRTDNLMIRIEQPEPLRPPMSFYLEEKLMDAEIYDDGFYRWVLGNLGMTEAQLERLECGYCELEAWRQYELLSYQADVALITYCTFHPARLLVAWVKPRGQASPFLEEFIPSREGDGTGDPIARLHLRRFKPLMRFLYEDLYLNPAAIEKPVSACIDLLEHRFKTKLAGVLRAAVAYDWEAQLDGIDLEAGPPEVE